MTNRSAVGNAKIAGMVKDLKMETGQGGLKYNTAVTLFFVPYTLLEVPSNIVLKVWVQRFSSQLPAYILTDDETKSLDGNPHVLLGTCHDSYGNSKQLRRPPRRSILFGRHGSKLCTKQTPRNPSLQPHCLLWNILTES